MCQQKSLCAAGQSHSNVSLDSVSDSIGPDKTALKLKLTRIITFQKSVIQQGPTLPLPLLPSEQIWVSLIPLLEVLSAVE